MQNTPFGKLQEGKHLVWGVDLSKRIVRVHQNNSPNVHPLFEKRQLLISETGFVFPEFVADAFAFSQNMKQTDA